LASTNGFILGLIGGVLDFASASLLLLGSGGGMMAEGAVPGYVWAAVLVVLGVAVITTSVLSVGSMGFRFARVFSLLMIIYGFIMMAIGLAMSTGYIVSTGVSAVYSLGMLLVGAGMVVNGVMMSRSPIPM
jgi:hypothetical protein